MKKGIKKHLSWVCLLFVAGIFLISCSKHDTGEKNAYIRSETLYVGGGLWSAPTNWNPLMPWSCTTGTIGLVYETLFTWDPMTNKMIPWLAKRGFWKSKSIFRFEIRKGVKWTDGENLTSKDVYFTFMMGKKHKGSYLGPYWDMIKSIKIIDKYTIDIFFKDARYHEWESILYLTTIVPEHIWSKKSDNDVLQGFNEPPVGTGPYKYETKDQTRMVYKRNDDWWAIKLLKMQPAPKRVVVLKIDNNNVAMSMVLKGDLDLSNFYLPGIPKVKQKYKDVHTWYKEAPYNLPNNTVWLFINNQKKPFNDPKFRRALAHAIDTEQIIKKVFLHQVIKSNSLGYVPVLSFNKYINHDIMNKYGFSYNLQKAKQLLQKAGYVDSNGDGLIEDKEGESISIELICPQGWSDWEESLKVVAKNFESLGIKAEAKFPDYAKYWSDLTSEVPKYDMALNNFESVSNRTIWIMLNWLTQKEGLEGTAEDGNYSRYNNEYVRAELDKFNRLHVKDFKKSKMILRKIQKIMLQDMPAIPLWFNGLWFQASKKHWTNWPGEKNPYAQPGTNNGQWHLGTIKVLCNIKPVK